MLVSESLRRTFTEMAEIGETLNSTICDVTVKHEGKNIRNIQFIITALLLDYI